MDGWKEGGLRKGWLESGVGGGRGGWREGWVEGGVGGGRGGWKEGWREGGVVRRGHGVGVG